VTPQELLIELRRLDVEIWLEDDRLRCSAPPDVLTPALRAELTRRKAELEALLRAAHAVTSGPIVSIVAAGTQPPFYAVPGHNGDVFCFVKLARCLGADRPFYGLQPPGLDDNSSPLESIEELADYFVGELLEHQPEGPFHIGGYCLGGLTAFEMARQLLAAGREVRSLVLFATMSPPALRPVHRARAVATDWIANRVNGMRTFLAASPAERQRRLLEKLDALRPSRADAVPPDEFTLRRLAVEQATVAAAYRYRPEVYDGRISLFLANQASTRSLDRPLEWARYTREGVHVFYGLDTSDGDSMLKDESVAIIAEQLGRGLEGLWPRLAL